MKSSSRTLSRVTVLCTLGALAACAGDPQLGERPEENLAEADLRSVEQPFLISDNSSNRLIKRAHAPIVVCLTGRGVTSANRANYESQIRTAIRAWLGAAQGASTATLTSTVNFSCVSGSPHAFVDVADTSGGASSNSDLATIKLFSDDAYEVVLHEFGHLFGLVDTYLNQDQCQPGQADAVMCDAETRWGMPQPDDINAIQEVYCKAFQAQCKRRQLTSNMNQWCVQSADQLLIGDFNRDGRADMLCHNKASGWKSTALANSSGLFTGTSWTSDMRWCNQSDDQLLIGDFNNDQRDDLLCHNKGTGWKSIALANSSGQFTGTSWTSDMRWCRQASDELLVGDFNNDGRDDMLCHSWSNGWKWIALANSSGQFTGTSWQSDMRWCVQSTDQLLLGDFNNDGRDDMLCHSKATGWKSTSLATSSGTFTGTTWTADMRWCFGANERLLLGDFNGDGRDDMLCQNANSGYKLIAFASSQSPGSFPGTSRGWAMSWCFSAGSPPSLLVGDFNNDHTSDFLCYSPLAGPVGTASQFP